MELPFEYGDELIRAVKVKREEDELDDMLLKIYFFSQHNCFNSEYDNFTEFKNSMLPGGQEEANSEEILDDVKNIIDAFHGGE